MYRINCLFNCDGCEGCPHFTPITQEAIEMYDEAVVEQSRQAYREAWYEYINEYI